MAVASVHFRSQVLEKQVTFRVAIPQVPGPWATFYLLHGLSDDYSAWTRNTNIERYAASLPLLVVMPDGGRGWWTNHNTGPAWHSFLVEDLRHFVETTFNVRREREARCIGGLSMGGYGALRTALGRPDLFASANSHSGAVLHGSRVERLRAGGTRRYEADLIFGDSPAGTQHDLLHLAAQVQANNALPALRIDCGTEDFLFDDNRQFTAQLNEMGVPHEYEEFPGAHEWGYWDLHVREALAFHARNLKL